MRRWWELLVLWLDDVLPHRCARCDRWTQKRKMETSPHVVAGWVFICPACYDELYPFHTMGE